MPLADREARNAYERARYHRTKVLRTVSLEPFQRRFAEMEPGVREGHRFGGPGLQPEDAATVIAARLGWYHRGWPDGGRVRVVLGLRPSSGTVSHGKYYPPRLRKRVSLETAHRLCEAMDLTPAEVDL